MGRMLDFCKQPITCGMNLDTGNTFIAGQDPPEFLKRFVDRVSHVHVKDVSESLATATRGSAGRHRHQPLRPGRRGQRRKHQEVPGPAGDQLPRGLEHGVRRPRRPDDRALAGLDAQDAG